MRSQSSATGEHPHTLQLQKSPRSNEDQEQPKTRRKFKNQLKDGELPGGPVDRTLSFHCWEHGFDPWAGTKILQAVQHGQKNKIK